MNLWIPVMFNLVIDHRTVALSALIREFISDRYEQPSWNPKTHRQYTHNEVEYMRRGRPNVQGFSLARFAESHVHITHDLILSLVFAYTLDSSST